jgi:hypothetical protein
MRVKLIVILAIMVLMLMAIAGCDSVPQEQIDEVNAAFDAAKKAGADKYVPEKFNAAKQALDRALAVVKEEESAMFSNFDEARNLIAAAKTAADEAAQAAPVKKAEVKAEAEALLAQIPGEVKSAMDAWRKAPRGKGTREALEQFKSEIEQADASQAEITTAIANEDYLTARQNAQATIKKLQSIQEEMKR